ncbi:MAG: hypothetical protein CL583_07050 [Alteromonadaceae bacterium]|nr:hypothetical protein [Alteromonadaceae bacterium]|tara:strand:- start:205 stop:765 length:561 start_codon:yes stop_codon:yes gene_type:complete
MDNDSLVIRFDISISSLGHVLVAQSEQGLCAILLGENEPALQRQLRNRFPDAELVHAQAELQELSNQVRRFLESPSSTLPYPLHINGTAFQQKVWEAIRQIPPGSTASYSDIARSIDSPQSVRAVAGACGANCLAVAIPCHRVVRSDGSLSGYRWGIERKRMLLEREAEMVAETQAPLGSDLVSSD